EHHRALTVHGQLRSVGRPAAPSVVHTFNGEMYERWGPPVNGVVRLPTRASVAEPLLRPLLAQAVTSADGRPGGAGLARGADRVRLQLLGRFAEHASGVEAIDGVVGPPVGGQGPLDVTERARGRHGSSVSSRLRQ